VEHFDSLTKDVAVKALTTFQTQPDNGNVWPTGDRAPGVRKDDILCWDAAVPYRLWKKGNIVLLHVKLTSNTLFELHCFNHGGNYFCKAF